jgi:acetate---CoA ligase (ADP-forming)
VLALLSPDPAVDALVVALPVLGQGYDIEAIAAGAAAFGADGCPTVVVSVHAPVASMFRRHGLPVFTTEVEAVAALVQWWGWHERVAAALARPFAPSLRGRPAEPRSLDEGASLALLAEAGVPVVRHQLCVDEEAAVAALAALGGPVALKGCSSSVTHKSELGLVALGLGTDGEVREAYSRVAAALRSVDPGAPGVLVAQMATGRRELMIGGRIDPVFGPVIVVGDGGAYVEVLPDLGVLLPPFRRQDVLAALARLHIAPVLAGVRGEPPCDVDSFADAVVAVSHLLDGDFGVAEFDVNPVLVGAAGEGCVALDAVVTVGAGQ